MNIPEQHPSKPSQKQLRTLREMAAERGVSFAYPTTMQGARVEFRKLKKIPKQDRRGQRREDRGVRDAMSARGGSSKVTDAELGGFNSSAHWK